MVTCCWLVSEVIPANQDLGFLYGDLTASEARYLIDTTRDLFGRDLAEADRAMVENGFAKIVRSGRREDVQCQPLTGPFEVDRSDFYLWSPDDEWSVEFRRFGSEWQKLGEGTSDQVAARCDWLASRSTPRSRCERPGACEVAPPGVAR